MSVVGFESVTTGANTSVLLLIGEAAERCAKLRRQLEHAAGLADQLRAEAGDG